MPLLPQGKRTVAFWRKRDSGFAETSEAAYKSARALGVAAAWSWPELAAAVWTERAQRLSAAPAKCAFVATDESITVRRKRRATALALLLHLESHTPNVTVPPPLPLRLPALTRVTSRRAECDLCRGIRQTARATCFVVLPGKGAAAELGYPLRGRLLPRL